MEVREHIISEADKLFSQFGFKSVTMDDIARHLGISKKTIYQHFADKNDLVNVLMGARFETHDCEIRSYADKAANAVQEVFLGLEDMNEWLKTLNPKLFYDLQKYYPEAWLKFKEFKEKNLKIGVANNLIRGIDEGVYRSDINIDILTELRMEHSQLIFSKYDHYAKNKYSIIEIMIEITQHFLYGIVNEKGKELIEEYKKQLNNESLKIKQ